MGGTFEQAPAAQGVDIAVVVVAHEAQAVVIQLAGPGRGRRQGTGTASGAGHEVALLQAVQGVVAVAVGALHSVPTPPGLARQVASVLLV